MFTADAFFICSAEARVDVTYLLRVAPPLTPPLPHLNGFDV